MADNLKSLVIKSSTVQPGLSAPWSPIVNAENFTAGIEIPDISQEGDSKVDIGSIVSGMPTIFARANMFSNALKNNSEEDVKGLMFFYSTLINEWKGLISCMALDYKNFKINRINLEYSDKKSIAETDNPYEVTGAFGNALFDRKELWCDQNIEKKEQVPFIDIIQYSENGIIQVVGGTSPESLLFTSSSYELKNAAPYVTMGKFTNPFADKKAEVSESDLIKIHSYVQHIKKQLEKFRLSFTDLEESLKSSLITQSIGKCLDLWIVEMNQFQVLKGYKTLIIEATPPEVGSLFNLPFSLVFNCSTDLYGLDGQIYNDGSNGGSLFNPNDLLLPITTEIAKIRFESPTDKKDFLKSKPLLLLEASTLGSPNEFAYFTLPLTPKALNIFGSQLDSLVGFDEASDVKSRISAIYDPNNKDGEKLIVTLTLFTVSGNKIEKPQVYNVNINSIRGKDILIWPNFISKQWNSYFLYSEIPHNDVKFQTSPFIGDVNDQYFKIVLDENDNPIYLAENGKTKNIDPTKYPNIKVQLHVNINPAVSDNNYKYEIYESNQPFKGIKFAFNGIDCGFGIIRYLGSPNTNLPHNMLSIDQQLIPARLGVDFGSTNSSVAYYSVGNSSICDSLTLKNRRISLLGDDSKNNDENPAVENEIFFFQNDEIRTNSIKSLLTIHDSRRLVNTDGVSHEMLAAQSVKGGFPCFEKNLPIDTAQNNKYNLAYNRVGKAELIYNMKWSDQPIDKVYKTAYLKSLLLHVYAQLFIEEHEPTTLKWSYPSSMGQDMKLTYAGIWDNVKDINPINSEVKLVIHPPSSDLGDTSGASSWGDSSNTAPLTNDSNNGWGDASSSGNSWGEPQAAAPTISAGWGNIETKAANSPEVKIETEPISFDFEQLRDQESLSESVALANYMLRAGGGFSCGQDELILCFDIGGSTTDISALCNMGNGVAMVKQNSIRFAAQRISDATKYSPNFKSVLLKMCEKKKIKIEGLNTVNNKFSDNTAPYYFEQVVDRLEATDFDEFYRLLAAECKEMMSVNLYVTGLIMYYAGQLTHKLRSEIVKSNDTPLLVKNQQPKIRIAFAGKGSQIFDWFNAIDPKAAYDYYTQMFIRGIGGENIAKSTIAPISQQPLKIIDINRNKIGNNSDVKYEVSKGLAIPTDITRLLVPKNKTAIEVLGEENFCVVTASGEIKYLEASNSITTQMMEQLGNNFTFLPPGGKQPCPRFMDFADLYYKVASNLFGLKMSQADFMNGFNDMNIINFIKGEKDYLDAQKRKNDQKPFDYVAPIIILEAMKFYESHLLKAIQGQ